jgi:hypothetical protein
MRLGRRELAAIPQISPRRHVTQNEPGGIVALAAETQQILVQALRQIEFAVKYVMERLPKGNLKELRGGTQLLPQLSCPGIGMAGFRRGEPLTAIKAAPKALQNSSSRRLRSKVSGNRSSWSSPFRNCAAASAIAERAAEL